MTRLDCNRQVLPQGLRHSLGRMVKRFLAVLLTLLALLGSGAAWAQKVLLSCDVGLKWGYVTEQSLRPENPAVVLQGPARSLDTVDTGELVVTSGEDARGNVFRIRSNSVRRSCGPFVIVLRADWFNANPMGEMGADDFSTIEFWRQGNRVLGPIALGSCQKDQGLSWGDCPKDWAMSITFMWERESMFSLTHLYDEQRRVP